ncbi:MAG: TolC family outer membrane protein [Neisseriaceae bacterium]|nr:TolC family outer membrane protein [Neisseriaceae bacterium]
MLKLNKYNLLIAALFFNIHISCYGFDLQDAWNAAYQYNAEYSAATHEKNAGLEAKKQGVAVLLPQLSANAVYQEQPQSMSNDAQSHGWNIQLQQPLFDVAKWQQYKQGNNKSKIAEIRFNQIDSQLKLDIGKAYFQVLQAQDNLTAIAAAKKAYTEQLAQVKAMFEVGAATQVDIDEVQSGYDAAVAKEVKSLSELNIARNFLHNATGLNTDDIEPIENKQLFSFNHLAKEEEWQKIAQHNNPELLLSQLKLEQANTLLSEMRANRLPVVSFSGGYQDMRYKNESNYQDYRYGRRGYSVSVNVSIPLFVGGQINSKVKEAYELSMQAQDLLTATNRKIALEIKQHYLSIHSGKSEIAAQEKLLQSTQSKLQSTQMGYEVGLRSNLDVVQAQQAYLEAQQQLAQAKYQCLIAYLQLLHTAGVLDDKQVMFSIR